MKKSLQIRKKSYFFSFSEFLGQLAKFRHKRKNTINSSQKTKSWTYVPTLPAARLWAYATLPLFSVCLSLSRASAASFALRCDAERRRISAPEELSAGCFVFRERVSVLSVRRIDHQLAATIFISSYYLGNWNADRTLPPRHLLSLWAAWPAWFAESSSCGL
jgi:hypothetical protein